MKKTTEKIKKGNYIFDETKDGYPANVFKCQFFKVDQTWGKQAYCSIRDQNLNSYENCCIKHEGDSPSKYLHCQSHLEKLGNMNDKDRLELRNLKLMKESVLRVDKSARAAVRATYISLGILVVAIASLVLNYIFISKQLKFTQSQLAIIQSQLGLEQERFNLEYLSRLAVFISNGNNIIVRNVSKIPVYEVLVSYEIGENPEFTDRVEVISPSEEHNFKIPDELKQNGKVVFVWISYKIQTSENRGVFNIQKPYLLLIRFDGEKFINPFQ